jgi:hypothetical protein
MIFVSVRFSYITQVDRCLKYFESTTEWADLIAALSKLNRVLQAHMKYPIIPRRIVIRSNFSTPLFTVVKYDYFLVVALFIP